MVLFHKHFIRNWLKLLGCKVRSIVVCGLKMQSYLLLIDFLNDNKIVLQWKHPFLLLTAFRNLTKLCDLLLHIFYTLRFNFECFCLINLADKWWIEFELIAMATHSKSVHINWTKAFFEFPKNQIRSLFIGNFSQIYQNGLSTFLTT